MLELLLILGAAYLGYKVVATPKSEVDQKTVDEAKLGSDQTTKQAIRTLDTRTDAERTKAGEGDLLKADLSELPLEIRTYVLNSLAHPLTTPDEIREGADALLKGCNKDLSDQARATVAGGSEEETDYQKLLKAALDTWCYPTAAARLLKVAKKKQDDIETIAATNSKADADGSIKKAPVVTVLSKPGVSFPSIADMSRIDIKELIRAELERELNTLPDGEPVMLRTNVAKLLRMTEGSLDLSAIKYDPEFVRNFANSALEYYNARQLAKVLYNFADALDAYQAARDEADRLYEESRRATAADERAAADWPILWNYDDKVLSPDLRNVARHVHVTTDPEGYVVYMFDDPPINERMLTDLISRVTTKISLEGGSTEQPTGGLGSEEVPALSDILNVLRDDILPRFRKTY